MRVQDETGIHQLFLDVSILIGELQPDSLNRQQIEQLARITNFQLRKGRLPVREHLEQCHPKGPHVRLEGVLHGLQRLRRVPLDGQIPVILRYVVIATVRDLSQSKVGDFHTVHTLDQDVTRRQIPMDDFLLE